MKIVSAALSLLVILGACSSTQSTDRAPGPASDKRLVGTWELVSTRITSGGSTLLEGTAPEMRSLKILNDTHYSVVTRRGDNFVRAGAGHYTLSGDTYTETVELASNARFTPGEVYTFRIRIDDDTWTLDGGSNSTRVEEVWRRVR